MKNKYEYAGCSKCENRGYTEFSCGTTGLYQKTRCDCSKVETEKYKKAKNKLAKKEKEFTDNPSKKTKKKTNKAKKKLGKFIDNNSHCNGSDNSINRSW